jgi:ribosomal protein S10
MFFYIQLSAKNKSSLKKFLDFITKIKDSNLIISSFSKKKVRKFLTVLKSPHVNKTAQEQFEFRIYSHKLRVKSLQSLKLLLTLKRIKKLSFPGVNLKIKSVFEKRKEPKSVLTGINPEKININFFNVLPNFKNNRVKNINKYLQVLDCYGEYSIKAVYN